MKKALIALSLVLIPSTALPSSNPNESKIFYHLHQAFQWAQLMYSNQCPFSNVEIRLHLGKIKYAQKRLVESKFYDDFIFLNKLSTGQTQSDIQRIESLRKKIETKAKKLKIKLPEDWKNEFFICSSQ